MMDNNKSQQPKTVVKGPVKMKNTPTKRTFTDTFLTGDWNTIKSYLVNDFLVPTAKKAIEETIRMFLWGSAGGRRDSNVPYISYNNSYGQNNNRFATTPATTSTRFDYQNIVLFSRGDAEEVLMQMQDTINRYGFVRVADLYDFVNMSAPHTANRYGWRNIRSARVVHENDGYVLDLPRAEPLDC